MGDDDIIGYNGFLFGPKLVLEKRDNVQLMKGVGSERRKEVFVLFDNPLRYSNKLKRTKRAKKGRFFLKKGSSGGLTFPYFPPFFHPLS